MTPSVITQSSSPASAASTGATLSDLSVQSLTRHSSSEAFVAGDRRLTYAQVRDLVSQCMGALSDQQPMRPGPRPARLATVTPALGALCAAPRPHGGIRDARGRSGSVGRR
ncbi:hypothetical protein QA811_34735 [Streptomyces sp. B21-102]|uniref:hypothetical protein n=1 Tax=Streptomyces sp. B21-102 TaxID=3039416 RepID=UPI002FF42FEA